MATDPSEFVSIFSPGGTKLTLPPASPAGSEAGGVGSAQSSQTPAQQGAAGSPRPMMNSNAEKTAEIRRLCALEFRLLETAGLDGHSLQRYI